MTIVAILCSLAASLLFALVALEVELRLSMRQRPRHGIWFLCLFASVLAPAILLFGPDTTELQGMLWPKPGIVAPGRPDRLLEVLGIDWSRIVGTFWAISSGTFVLLMLIEWTQLRAIARNWKSTVLDGTQVKVSQMVGPAIVGAFAPSVVVPSWLFDVDPDIRAAALDHERQHIKEHDPLLSMVGLVLVSVMPWNPVLYWQLRRLRLAIEIDCDARVMRRCSDRSAYAKALLYLAERRCSQLAFASRAKLIVHVTRRIRILLDN